jgi:hypothetical protein
VRFQAILEPLRKRGARGKKLEEEIRQKTSYNVPVKRENERNLSFIKTVI